jgi:gamma-glutamyltranspeptidase/glutathione hydrolase
MKRKANSVAVATTSQLAADAAEETAELGGNAVDCGIAAAMCSINTQPGVCALAGSAYVTVWPADGEPVTIDGNVAIPGRGMPEGRTPEHESVTIDYGGGVTTLVGASSVAVPGTLRALFLASQRYGSLPWSVLMQPSIRAARDGFPFPQACHYYLSIAAGVIYDRSADGFGAIHDAAGRLLDVGSTVIVPHLADSLAVIAEEGERALYDGDLGKTIVDHVQSRGGQLTMEDLRSYQPDVHEALQVDIGDWRIATNPPPAIGGVNLAAMLLCFGTDPFDEWNGAQLQRLVDTQRAVMSYRRACLDRADDVFEPARRMLELARDGDLVPPGTSGSTVHTSAVDDAGTGCAITASSGYGSGEMPAGTGLWLNNCLGELELNYYGLEAGPPGKRLPSNMAPGCARSGRAVVAIGSPGADRITTALHQFLVNFMQRGLDLDEAVAHPRLHLAIDVTHEEIAVEPGIDLPDSGVQVRLYDDLNMYFGGVVAAKYDDVDGFDAAADPRREGGTTTGPAR